MIMFLIRRMLEEWKLVSLTYVIVQYLFLVNFACEKGEEASGHMQQAGIHCNALYGSGLSEASKAALNGDSKVVEAYISAYAQHRAAYQSETFLAAANGVEIGQELYMEALKARLKSR